MNLPPLRWLIALTLFSSLTACALVPVEPLLLDSADRLEISSETADLELPALPSTYAVLPLEKGDTFTATAPNGALVLDGLEATKYLAYVDVAFTRSRMAEALVTAARQAEAERNEMVETVRAMQDAHNQKAVGLANSETARGQEAYQCSLRVAGYQSVLAIFGLAGFIGGF